MAAPAGVGERYVLGLDIGTSRCKVCAVDAAGRLARLASSAYPTHSPLPGWAEQDPAHWLDALAAATHRVLFEGSIPAASVAGLALSGAAQVGVLVDGDGRPVRPAILWSDQ